MAEYFILAVGYSEEEEHIEWALVARFETNHDCVMTAVVERDFLVDLLRTESATFRTATVNPATGKFRKGADVHVIGDEFLSTDANDVTHDNLGKLPRFKMPKCEFEIEELFPLLEKKS